MAMTLFQTCQKKRKRRTPIIYNNGGVSSPFKDLYGAFRENIRWFIKQCCEAEEYRVAGNPTWSTLLVGDTDGVVFPLYAVEEDVKPLSYPFCDLCRCVGWGHHFVSKRRYHLIIPRDCEWNSRLKNEALHSDTHFLHGMIHCNGFGHLLCLNGSEKESNYLSGTELMDLWDCICTTLRTRKITVHDVSKTRSMDMRLIYGVAYGQTWFGKWGYKFCRGSFGVTEQKYNRAIAVLRSLDLDRIILDFGNVNKGQVVQRIIERYKEASKTRLDTISDLLRFLIEFKFQTPIRGKAALEEATICSKISLEPSNQKKYLSRDNPPDHVKFSAVSIKSDSRWPVNRLEYTAKVIASILIENKSSMNEGTRASMSRHELREAARQRIGDTGLIDFVLKSINNAVVGDHIIRRLCNPRNKLLEFFVEKVEHCVEPEGADVEAEKTTEGAVVEAETTRVGSDVEAEKSREGARLELGLHVSEDMLCLYKNVLLGYPDHHPVSIQAKTILHCKHFIKEWQFNNYFSDDLLLAVCQVMPSFDELATKLTQPLPPGEVIMVPKIANIGELKLLAQNALRDTYVVTESFVVKDVKRSECRAVEDLELFATGSGLNLGTKLRYEGGIDDDDWAVNCPCGAKEDDGERMVACDMCQVWEHTKCNNIQDNEAVPRLFLCSKCNEKVKWECRGRQSTECPWM